MAKRYRKRGLDKTARRMVGFLEQRGIEGATVLEVGGGVGEIQIELLKRGAAHTVNLELSSAYDAEADRLLGDAGLQERAERRLHDIAVEPDAIEPADVVSVVVDNTHLENDDVRNVKVLERFAFVEVPAERAGQVAEAVSGNEVRGVQLRMEVTTKP